ncbi:MAG: hypothetical protein ACTSYS_07465, partial [Promethearchaeota archaeon]
VKPVKPVMAPEKPAISAGPVGTIDEANQEKLKTFKETREKIEEMESKAFQLIDEAKLLTEEEKYTEALATYTAIKTLLRNAGWSDEQLEPILVQESLIKDVMEESLQPTLEPTSTTSFTRVGQEDGVRQPKFASQKFEKYMVQDEKLRTLKAKKIHKQELEKEAFDLIDQAQKLYKNVDFAPDYLKAIEIYQQAIKLFRQAGWIEQVAYLETEVQNLRVLHAREQYKQQQLAEAEKQKEELEKMRKMKQIQQTQDIKGSISSVTSMLKNITEKKKELERLEEEETIMQKLIEEKKRRAKYSGNSAKISFDSLKKMLFDFKGEEKKPREIHVPSGQKDETYLSEISRKLKELKASKDFNVRSGTSAGTVSPALQQRRLSGRSTSSQKIRVIDPKLKQEREMKAEELQKKSALKDALSMLSSLKSKDKDKQNADDTSKSASESKDPKLKSLLDDLKKIKNN